MGQTECSMRACRPCGDCDRNGEAGTVTYMETHSAKTQAPAAQGQPILLGGSPRRARGLRSDGEAKFVSIVPTLGGESELASWDVPEDAALQVEKVARMEQMWSKQREEREKKQAEEEKQLRRQQRKLMADAKVRQQQVSALDQLDMMADEELTRLKKKEDEQARVRNVASQQAKEEAAACEASELEAARASAEASRPPPGPEETKASAEAFLKARGFKNVLAPRRALCGASAYALHMAVEENKVDTVRALLASGAHKDQKDSSNMTAVEVGVRCNKNGSHDRVLELLQGELVLS